MSTPTSAAAPCIDPAVTSSDEPVSLLRDLDEAEIDRLLSESGIPDRRDGEARVDLRHRQAVAAAKKRFMPQSAAELDHWYDTTPPPAWLITRLIPEDAYGVIGAATKSMKTFAAAALAVAVATGEPWLGQWEVGKTGSTLMFWGEGGMRAAVRRMRAVAAHYGADFRELPVHIVADAPTLLDDAHMEAVAAHLQAIRPTLVIVDPAFLSLLGVPLKSAELVYEALNRLRFLVQEVGGVLVFVHHWNKSGTGSDFSRFSGAGLAEWGRFLLSLDGRSVEAHAPGQTAKVLHWRATGGEAAEVDWHTLVRVHAVDPDDLHSALVYSDEPVSAEPVGRSARSPDDGRHRCLAALAGLRCWATVAEVLDHANRHLPTDASKPLTRDNVRKTLARLAKDGAIQERGGPAGSPNHYADKSFAADAVATDQPAADTEPDGFW